MIIVRMKSENTVCQVVDTDTGDKIKGVGRIEIVHEIGSRAQAEIHMISEAPSKYNLEAEARFFVMSTKDGQMKAVKQIQFEDGEIIDYGDPA